MDSAGSISDKMKETRPELSVVVPVYQEEDAISPFLSSVEPVLERLTSRYEIIFCMDPGRDHTEEVIVRHISKNARIRLLVLTRRWGQPASTTAGIEHCLGAACVIMDVDLQDPPELIEQFYEKWKEGYKVVYAERSSRKGETWHHLLRASIGYWLINRIAEMPVPRNTGDFRLIDREVIEALKGLRETHGYLRGLVPYVGFKQIGVHFDRPARRTGRSKYNQFIGSMRININGLIAFSTVPLQLASMFGLFSVCTGLVLMLIVFVRNIFLGQPLTSLSGFLVALLFMGGVQLLCLGILGEYVGRIYEESRGRPKYLIDRMVNFS